MKPVSFFGLSLLLFTAAWNTTYAGNYFGFNLDQDTYQLVVASLKKDGAVFKENRVDTLFKQQKAVEVSSSKMMEKYDPEHTAFLLFDHNDILYRFMLTWRDKDNVVFDTMKTALDKKYTLEKKEEAPAATSYVYRDGNTTIILSNSFAYMIMGMWPTTLSYISDNGVARIDEYIENEQKMKSNDLTRKGISDDI